jgi:hypothetical protein
MLILLVTFGIHDVDSVVLSTKPAFSTLCITPVSSSACTLTDQKEIKYK